MAFHEKTIKPPTQRVGLQENILTETLRNSFYFEIETLFSSHVLPVVIESAGQVVLQPLWTLVMDVSEAPRAGHILKPPPPCAPHLSGYKATNLRSDRSPSKVFGR